MIGANRRNGAVAMLVIAASALAGCASFSFKRGAAPGASTADERACRAAGGGDDAYIDCMREKGWFIPQGGAARRATAPPASISAPLPSPSPGRPAPTAANTPPPSNSGAAAATTARGDALELTSVASWWKLGGNASDLDRDIAACVIALGEAHRPAAGATAVTNAMRACLREHGWYPLVSGGSAR